MTQTETIRAIEARSVPLAAAMIDHDAQDDSYYAGYLAGYVHASDRAIDLIHGITYADVTREMWGDPTPPAVRAAQPTQAASGGLEAVSDGRDTSTATETISMPQAARIRKL